MTRAILGAIALAAALFATPAHAAAPTTAKAILLSPLSLLRIADMNFATLRVTANGTATINAASGVMTTTGGLSQVGGTVSQARFTGTAARAALIWIQIPTGSYQLVRQGGTQVLILDNFTLDRFPLQLVGNTPFTFGVGARLTVPGNAVEGVYGGTFAVTINYY